MQRPTRTITTEGGYTVVLNEYITGAENWEIRKVYIKGVHSGVKDGSTELEADRKGYELTVVSVDGPGMDGADVATRVLALPLPDYKEVVAAIGEVIDGKKKSSLS